MGLFTRFTRLLLVFFVLFFTLPAFAQDTTPEPAATQEIVTTSPALPAEADVADTSTSRSEDIQQFIVFGLFALVAFFGISQTFWLRFISRFVPPEVAKTLIDTGAEWALKASLNQAAKTPDTADDDYFIAEAKRRGFAVTRHADGTYNLQKVSPVGETPN